MKFSLICIYVSYLLMIPCSRKMKGYVVTWHGDTSVVEIISPDMGLGFSSYDVNKEIEIIDSTGTQRNYFTRDIKAFGYQERKEMLIFRLKPTPDGEDLFQKAVLLGDRVNLFFYHSNSYNLHFTIEKMNGLYLFLNSSENAQQIKNKLKVYFNDCQKVIARIDQPDFKPIPLQKCLTALVEIYNQ